jgi:S13-like H2TH domain
MTGPVGADDPALEQAKLAQLAPRAYLDGWRGRCALAADAGAPPSPTPENTLAMAPTADQVEGISARPGLLLTRVEDTGVRATDEALPRVSPKPVPPALAPGQRDAALSKARLLNSKHKAVRDQLRQGSLSLAQALAQDGEAARGMRVVTVVRALPGIGAATARRLMATAGIDGGRRVGGLTAGQTARLLAAVAGRGR